MQAKLNSAESGGMRIITGLMFRLLPIQILLATTAQINGLVSGYFASNYIGINAMSAVGLYGPVNMLINALSVMLVGGATIICGRYIGMNRRDKVSEVFSLDIVMSVVVSIIFIADFCIGKGTFLAGFLTKDPEVRSILSTYLIGQAIGILPLILSNQLSSFLSLENKVRRTTIASVIFIIVNIILNVVFVRIMKLEAFGLALAASAGAWVFFMIQAQYFVRVASAGRAGRSLFIFRLKGLNTSEIRELLTIGIPGALNYLYQTFRGLIVNSLLETHVGVVGISAFAAVNNLLSVFWAIPIGMLAVSRLLISVSIGEEDRKTLADIMRVMFLRYVPLMTAVCLIIMALAGPVAGIYFKDTTEQVYQMTVLGIRIMPLCMPLAIISMHFTCYGQASDKTFFVHFISILDGVVCVAGFTALLVGSAGMSSAYIANVLNGVVCVLFIIIYSVIRRKRLPHSMEDLMVMPEDFGADENDRIDISIRSMDEVVAVSQKVQKFCQSKGIDDRRSYIAGLSMEEMAGNIVDHGFTQDSKKHSIDVRVVHKAGSVILRLRDDCIPFDPAERIRMAEQIRKTEQISGSGSDGPDPKGTDANTYEPEDFAKNIGIRMVHAIAEDIKYQNILGLNVLTIKI